MSEGIDVQPLNALETKALLDSGSARTSGARSIQRLLMGADLVALLAAFLLAGLVDDGGDLVYLLTLPLWLVGARFHGLYVGDRRRTDHSTLDETAAVFHLLTLGAWIVLLGSAAAGARAGLLELAVFWSLGITLTIASRAGVRSYARRRTPYLQNAIIVGAGDVGQLIGRKLLQHVEYGIRLVGFVDAEPRELRQELAETKVLGAPSDLRAIVDQYDVDRVIVAFSNDSHDELLAALRSLPRQNVQIDIVPRLFEAVGSEFGTNNVEGLPLVGVMAAHPSRSALLVKRCIDAVGASLALIVMAPVFLLIAVLIKLDSPGPVFFRQRRLGQNMREFTMLKFRTMHHAATDDAHRRYVREIMDTKASPTANSLYKLERRDAVTRVGRLLRELSLDEVPQLVNVFRGDMSLVGPRPCLAYETEVFAPHHFERFLLPAGLTGLWQVKARARATFREALDLDVAYVRGWSLMLDARLLLRTPFATLRKGKTA